MGWRCCSNPYSYMRQLEANIVAAPANSWPGNCASSRCHPTRDAFPEPPRHLRARPEAASADAGRTAGTHSASAVCAFERSGSSEAVHRSPQCTGIGLEPCSSPKKEQIIITISIIITILTSSCAQLRLRLRLLLLLLLGSRKSRIKVVLCENEAKGTQIKVVLKIKIVLKIEIEVEVEGRSRSLKSKSKSKVEVEVLDRGRTQIKIALNESQIEVEVSDQGRTRTQDQGRCLGKDAWCLRQTSNDGTTSTRKDLQHSPTFQPSPTFFALFFPLQHTSSFFDLLRHSSTFPTRLAELRGEVPLQ